MQALIRVEAEELADDLDRQHLAVGEDRRRATRTQPTLAAQVADKVVHEAKDGDDEGLQVHGRPSLWLIHREERLGPVSAPSASSYSKTCTSGLLRGRRSAAHQQRARAAVRLIPPSRAAGD